MELLLVLKGEQNPSYMQEKRRVENMKGLRLLRLIHITLNYIFALLLNYFCTWRPSTFILDAVSIDWGRQKQFVLEYRLI